MVRAWHRTILLLAAVFIAGCAPAGSPGSSTAEPDNGTDTSIENYPDAQTRALAARARERRPVEASALPPRHLDPERWPETLVDRNQIVSGGPPPDGIPSIDDPRFGPVASIDWIDDDEAVTVMTIDDRTRIYPVQILLWHEIVNDVIGEVPVTMTYCPLCNSVVAFERTMADGTVLDFGTSGALYRSALVMYDRQTETLWTHFDGRAVVGALIGTELTVVPAAIVSWADARSAHPQAEVLQRPTGPDAGPYGTAPYPNYEDAPPSAGHVPGEVDDRLPPKQRVVGVELGRDRLAIDRRALEAEGVVTFELGGRSLVALWTPGAASALDGERVAHGTRVGSVGVFETSLAGDGLDFEATGHSIVDRETGSTWSVLGVATAGPLAGQRLVPVPHLDTFWFAWSQYHPTTDVAG